MARSDLEQAIGAELLSFDPSDLATYGRDWTKVYAPAPVAIAWPRCVEDVVRIVKACVSSKVAIVPSGGRTGLAGGAVAANGELVLSLERMRAMGPVDVLGETVRVEAGAITEAVHRHCEPHGLTWPVDFASKGSSQVGGNIATNAGGVRVIRYGLTRQWVLGLQVVTMNGDVLELGGALEKNNTGLDLRQLFIGSEGTLGVITAATLKLTKLPPPARVLLFGVPDLASVLALFRRARASGPFTIAAYEFFTRECLARVRSHRKIREPFESAFPYYVLCEVERSEESTLEAFTIGVLEDGIASDGTMSQDAGQAAALWELREGISESLSATGLPHKNDISLPIAALEAFCSELGSVFGARYPGVEICLFGHIGDGNLHVNVMKPDAMAKEAFLNMAHEADHAMFALVQKHGGSISAEHGIGLLKKDFLAYTRSATEIELMRACKRVLDPDGLLNPGKIF